MTPLSASKFPTAALSLVSWSVLKNKVQSRERNKKIVIKNKTCRIQKQMVKEGRKERRILSLKNNF